ncbi:protein AIM2 [Dichotomopilus funicola]|uniref:Protein AIM2 n=1 Tax=Dichotomopilus funicola TaxID=1934379 RepID=A0AAN6ZN10_9PEZI|nr:protein AIM2 [Dichotomopilus funicola]
MSCPDCFKGTLRGDVVLTGTEEVIHGIPTYVARPDAGVETRGTIVILPDAFGWGLQNTRALADAYAKRLPGVVYVPDFMNGHAAPVSFLSVLEKAEPPSSAPPSVLIRAIKRINTFFTFLSFVPAMATFLFRNRASVTQPRIRGFLAAERKSAPTTPIGVAGFCWGGLHAVLLTHDVPHNKVTVGGDGVSGGQEYPLIDCSFTAHPSLLSLPKDIEQVVKPLSVANGSLDDHFGPEKVKILEEVLDRKNREAGLEAGDKKYESVVYPGGKHGFAIRGDRTDPEIREKGEQSEAQAVEWFKRWFP